MPLAIYHRRHPIDTTPSQPGIKRFAIEVVHGGCLREPSPVSQAVNIEDCARRLLIGIRYSSNKHTALAAKQKVTGAAAKSVKPNEIPNISRHI